MANFQPDPGQTIGKVGAGLAAGAAVFGGAGSMSAAAMEATKTETQELVNAAKSGGFKISEEGVKPLLEAIKDMKEELSSIKRVSSTVLSQAPQLGSHDYGHAVAQHDQKAATHQEGSAGVVLDQFELVLDQAAEALERAAGIYQESEGDAQSSFRTLQA
jgi:hypothetical protein